MAWEIRLAQNLWYKWNTYKWAKLICFRDTNWESKMFWALVASHCMWSFFAGYWMGIDFKRARREIESDWLSVCIVSMLFLGCCESAARLFNSEIITALLKYLYCLEWALGWQNLCVEASVCACLYGVCMCDKKNLSEIGGVCVELCIEKP